MADQSIIARHSSASQTAPATLVDFGVAVQKILINTFTNDVHVEFNGVANGDSFRISATQPAPTFIEVTGSNVRTVSLLGVAGTADVYLLGIVN